MWVAIGILALSVYAIYKYITANNGFWQSLGVPWIDANKISSVFRRMTLQDSIIDFHRKLYAETPASLPYFGYNELRSKILYIKDLDLVKKVMIKDFDYFMDRRPLIHTDSKSDIYMSRMLVNMMGQEWKDLRAIMSPTFSTGKIRRMFEFFNACGHSLSAYLKDESKHVVDGEANVVDFQDCFSRYTIEAIGSIALGQPTDVFQNQDSVFRKMVKRFQYLSFKRMFGVLFYMMAPSVARFLGLRVSDPMSMDFFAKIVVNNIDMRRKQNIKRQDFLQLLLEAQSGQLKADENEKLDDFEKDAVITGSGKFKDSAVVLNDQTVIAQTILFFAAGADTIETVLTYAVYHLALNPDIQERLAAEVTDAMDEHDGNLTYEVTHQLEYLDMVVSETLRLNTPGFFAERVSTKDYTIPDTKIVIPKGVRAQVSIIGIHRDEKYYSNPNEFNPEHFTAANKAKRHPYAYLPFGQGPRNCIAMRFAITETKAALAHLVYNFRLEPCSKTQIPVVTNKKSFKPNNMWLRFTPRR